MDEEAFRIYLRRNGRSKSAIDRIIRFVLKFEQYLFEHRHKKSLDEATAKDLDAFTFWIEAKPKASAKLPLWGIKYYYKFTSNDELYKRALELREQRVGKIRKPFLLRNFRGVNPDYAKQLTDIGIKSVEDILAVGRTPANRRELARKSGVPLNAILEFVKLADLSRIPGLKSIRARLFYDAGVDTLEKLAKWNPVELRVMLIEFVEKTGFDGMASLPKEAEFSVETAKKLPKIVEFE